MKISNFLPPSLSFQIQHPRSNLKRFDLVITPRHDYYPLTPQAQEQVPWFLRRWITPREHPGKNVVSFFFSFFHFFSPLPFPSTSMGQQLWSFPTRCWKKLIRVHLFEFQILTVGALHQADPIALQIAASSWHDKLAPLLKPLLVVNVGGPTSKSATHNLLLLLIFILLSSN